MNTANWGLNESPTGKPAAAPLFFRTAGHDEALARLHYLVDAHRRLGLLTGPAGVGKTTLLKAFANECREAKHAPLHVNLAGVTADEFPWLLAERCGLLIRRQAGATEVWRKLADRVSENRYQQRATIVLLDVAEAADPRVMDQVVRLMHFDADADSRLTAVLAITADGMHAIPSHLLNLVELRIELDAWQPEDTAAFLAEASSRGVYHGAPLSPETARRIHDLAQGIPRRINQLVELAIIATAGGGDQNVDTDTVDRVHNELVGVNS